MKLDERILRSLGQAVIDHITAQAQAPLAARVTDLEARLAEFTNGVEKPIKRRPARARTG